MSDPLRDALRRNALMTDVLAEGYLPSTDSALQTRIGEAMRGVARRRRRHRYVLGAGLAAALAVALTMPSRAPLPGAPALPPPVPVATPAPTFLIVTTAAAAPVFETVSTSTASFLEVVRTAQLIGPLERLRDEELLATGGVMGLVGHPGGVRRVIVTTHVQHRFLE